MGQRLPEIHPISDLARDARALVARSRDQQEPIVITQRGRDVAVLLPIELFRDMQRRLGPRVVSPRLVRAEDAALFRKTLDPLDPGPPEPSAGV
jgi:prevent-host-death family protein